jgi:hypothetical protein
MGVFFLGDEGGDLVTMVEVVTQAMENLGFR